MDEFISEQLTVRYVVKDFPRLQLPLEVDVSKDTKTSSEHRVKSHSSFSFALNPVCFCKRLLVFKEGLLFPEAFTLKLSPLHTHTPSDTSEVLPEFWKAH